MIFDVNEADFAERVVERSREVPVVVDFWAEWCGPCRTLTPALEAAISKREGRIELAKVDVDRNQSLAMSFGVRGIPAVKAFREGQVAAEFTGALPSARVEEFIEGLLPSPADELARAGGEESLRKALELDPKHTTAGARLGRLLIERGEIDEALDLLGRFEGDFVAVGLAARARLGQEGAKNGANPEKLSHAFAAWDACDHESALEALQEALASTSDREVRDLIRRVMVAIFTELGPEDPLAREHRRRLSAALN
jgi:putative thioredoxin